MRSKYQCAVLWVFLAMLGSAEPVLAAGPTAVSTFHSIGIYWSPSGGSSTNTCSVRYRPEGSSEWKNGYPLWYAKGTSPLEYRGSLVNLAPGTTYEIELRLKSGKTTTFTARTWSETFPVARTVTLPATSDATLAITESGTPSGYVLYTPEPGGTATIDVANSQDYCITVNASYVIFRGLTLRNARVHGIQLLGNAHDVVIEENDISGWGRIDTDGWGVNYDAAVYANVPSLTRIIIQRNRMHHPRSDANNWSECRSQFSSPCHPRGPEAVTFFDSAGNHVIRYNEIYSDADHYFNDPIGGGSNFSSKGNLKQDSDVYGNSIQNFWDDGIEVEGANRNNRIWGNWLNDAFVDIAVTATRVGPVYVWRNVSGRHPYIPGSQYHSYNFLKAGADKTYGRIYVFHSTLRQPEEEGAAFGIGTNPIRNVWTRNNIFQVSDKAGMISINDTSRSTTNSFDYDLYNGTIKGPSGSERNGIRALPAYDPNNGPGEFALDLASPGYDAGARLFNFNDGYTGNGPDMGAHEAGTPPMEFGVDAYRPKPVSLEPDLRNP